MQSDLIVETIPIYEEITFLENRFKKIPTSSSGDLCGLVGIAHYVARREFHERIEIYKNILRHKHRTNPDNIEQLNNLSDSWFIFLEDFLKKRNDKATQIIDYISSNQDEYIDDSNIRSMSSDIAESNKLLMAESNKLLMALQNSTNPPNHLDGMDKILFDELIPNYPKLQSQLDNAKFIELFAITPQKEMLKIASESRQGNGDLQYPINSFRSANQGNEYFWMVYLFLDYRDELKRIISLLGIQDNSLSLVRQANDNFNFGEADLKNLFKMAIRGLSFEELDGDIKPDEKKLLIKSNGLAQIRSISPQHDCLLENNRGENHYTFLEPENSITPFSTIGCYASSIPLKPKLQSGNAREDPASLDLALVDLASNRKIIHTSADNFFSGYCAIGNYIKFLSPSQRLEVYRKILAKAWQKKYSASVDSSLQNPFETDVPNQNSPLNIELRFVEEFLKRREVSKENKDRRKEFDIEEDKKDFNAIKNHQSGIYRANANHINSLDYDNIIKKYFLNGEVQSTQGKLNVIFGDNILQDKNKMIKRSNILDSYQIWIAGMIAYFRDQGNKISEEELKESFDELFPTSSTNCYHPKIPAVSASAPALNQPTSAFEPNDENLLYLENFQLRAIEELSASKLQNSSNPNEKIFYQSLNLILGQLKNEPHGYQHFLSSEEYDKFFENNLQVLRLEINTYCDDSIDKTNADNIFHKALQYFKTEFSFERQNFHAQYFNRLQVYNKSNHFSTLVSQERFDNPFPREESIESIYSASINKQQIKTDIQQTIQSIIASIKPQQIEGLQDNIGNEQDESFQTPSPSPQIFYRTTSLFQKISGRKDDNFRYASNTSSQHQSLGSKFKYEVIEVIKYSVNEEDDEKTNENIVLAMLIAKNFGGIGTKIAEIEGKIADQSSNDKYLKELLKISYPAEIDPVDKTPEEFTTLLLNKTALEDKFEKLKFFSESFQIQCKQLGIYSGNKAINESIFSNQRSIETKHGLRLAFIPDEIVVEYINKLPKDNQVRKLAMNIIKENKSKNIGSSHAR
jgi:hypothetical protein